MNIIRSILRIRSYSLISTRCIGKRTTGVVSIKKIHTAVEPAFIIVGLRERLGFEEIKTENKLFLLGMH